MPNRLAKETSPYLLQHKDNPVEWFPWGDEALGKARADNKPILLSIGYSACHWCHVMEHESFENVETARLMNEHYVSIKVDREERPDLDQIYQNVAQAMTHGGGWPLTVFLTPDLMPFYGGTYFPPEDKYGRAGFPRVLRALSEAWRDQPDQIRENAKKLTEYIGAAESTPAKKGSLEISKATLESAAEALLSHVDWDQGGLGDAPKFPNVMTFDFLWRLGCASGSGTAKTATLLTLRKMAAGGIYDQLGGGFHRYSVDSTWSVPHFEKMLYDNGLLLRLYSEVLLSDDKTVEKTLSSDDRELFVDVVSETVEYLLREMVSADGGFYAAQDADSEGEEGKFFVWDPTELDSILSKEEARVFKLRFGVTIPGNFEHGKTVLHHARTFSQVADEVGIPEAEARSLARSARSRLLDLRGGRVPPATDTKVLTAWNGLAISGLAWATQALKLSAQPELAQRARAAAEKAFKLVETRFAFDGNRLYSTFQGGKPKFNGYLDDYAFMSMAALDLARFESESTAIAPCLASAVKWIQAIQEHFKDPSSPGYFFTSADHEALIHRPKTLFDQAIPSGTAVALQCMSALGEIDFEESGSKFEEELISQLDPLYPSAARNPHGGGELLSTALLRLMGPIVVSGPQAYLICHHPHVFQKGSSDRHRHLVCQRKVCSKPLENDLEALADVTSRLAL